MKYQQVAAWTGIFILCSHFIGNPALAVSNSSFGDINNQQPNEQKKGKAAIAVAGLLGRLIEGKKYNQALEIANQAITNYPGFPLFHLYRGIALFSLDQKKAAMPDFETARKLFISQFRSANTDKEKRLIQSGLRTIELYLFLDEQ